MGSRRDRRGPELRAEDRLELPDDHPYRLQDRFGDLGRDKALAERYVYRDLALHLHLGIGRERLHSDAQQVCAVLEGAPGADLVLDDPPGALDDTHTKSGF